MKKIGLYPGTFNPIHNGHVTLANYFINNTELDEVWVVTVSYTHLTLPTTPYV